MALGLSLKPSRERLVGPVSFSIRKRRTNGSMSGMSEPTTSLKAE